MTFGAIHYNLYDDTSLRLHLCIINEKSFGVFIKSIKNKENISMHHHNLTPFITLHIIQYRSKVLKGSKS